MRCTVFNLIIMDTVPPIWHLLLSQIYLYFITKITQIIDLGIQASDTFLRIYGLNISGIIMRCTVFNLIIMDTVPPIWHLLLSQSTLPLSISLLTINQK